MASAGPIEEEGEVIYLATEDTRVALLSQYLRLQKKFGMGEQTKTKNTQEIPLKRVPLICTDCGCDLGRSSADQIFLLKDKVYCRGCKEDLTVNSLKAK
jgi:hypothetical protein